MLDLASLAAVFLFAAAFWIVFYLFFEFALAHMTILKRLRGQARSIRLAQNIEVRKLIKNFPVQRRGILPKVEKKLLRASVDMSATNFLGMMAALGLLSCLILVLATGLWAVAIASLASEPVLIIGVLNRLERKRVRLFSAQLPNAIDSISSSLKAGFSLLQALNSIAETNNPPMSAEIKLVLQDISLGKSYDEAFDKMLERNPNEDLEIMITAILINKETGGNLATILDTVAGTIRERTRLQGEIRSLTAQGRLSGMVLALLPIGVLIFLSFLNPGYIKPLFVDSLGKMLLVAGVCSELIGFVVIKKIINIGR